VLGAGTSIGMFGGTSVSYGLNLGRGVQLLSQGLATAHNWIVEYNTVQEQPCSGWTITNWSYGGYNNMIQDAPSTTINCRFTDWSVPAQDVIYDYPNYATVNLQDCQLHGGIFAYASTGSINLTNCLLERVWTYLQPSGPGLPLLANNLFFGGLLELYLSSPTNGVARDNLFDRTTIQYDENYWGYTGGHNAYVTNYNRLIPTNASDLILSSPPSYQVGPLENYYEPSNSPLINVGSTNATNVAMFHYTVMTNLVSPGWEIKETNSVVDIGFHAVAVDSNGVPSSTSGDVIGDYLLDSNGDGIYDAGDLGNWQAYNSPNGLTTNNGLEVFTPLH